MVRDFIAKDFWLKLFSLFLAVVIWTTVHFAMRNESAQPGPGEIRTFSKLTVAALKSAHDARPLRVNPAVVAVTVIGKPPVLQTLTGADIAVFINLTDTQDAEGGSRTVQVRVPEGLTVLRVEPRTVRVENLSD